MHLEKLVDSNVITVFKLKKKKNMEIWKIK